MQRKVIAISSRTAAIVFGIITFLMFLTVQDLIGINTADSAIIALCAMLIFLIFLDISGAKREARYREAEHGISDSVLLRERAGYIAGAGERYGGYVYVTDTRLYFYSREHKPYFDTSLEIADITDIRIVQDFNLCITTVSNKRISIISPNVQNILNKIKSVR